MLRGLFTFTFTFMAISIGAFLKTLHYRQLTYLFIYFYSVQLHYFASGGYVHIIPYHIKKTLNRMLLNRIQPHLEKVLRDNQNGFRPGRSTTSHILALRRIIEGTKAKNLQATMVFIDFKKAFDSVHRGLLMKILRAYGIPDVIVRLIERIYTGTKAKVLTADGVTEVFDILAGVLQGDTLAPYLFIIVIDYIMTLSIDDDASDLGFTLKPARSRRVKAEKFVDTEFADDISLVTNTKTTPG